MIGLRDARKWLALLAGLTLAGGPAVAAPPPPTGAARKAVPTARPAPKPARGSSAALPDSVLARVGDEDITVARFVRAALRANPQARPDSLTPQERRRFLDLLIDQAVLTRRVRGERFTWTAQESAQYAGLRDRLMLNAALDSVLREAAGARRAAGLGAMSPESLGVAARESTVARLSPRFDEALIGRLAAAFDSLPRAKAGMPVFEQLRIAGVPPRVSAEDSLSVLVSTSNGPYLAADLLENWKRLNPIYRPRVSSPDQVRDLARNGIFERLLRREAATRRFDGRPDVAATLAENAQFHDVTRFVWREVYEKIPLDSTTLRRHYRSELAKWDLPKRARVFRMVFPDRPAAEGMARRLWQRAEAESLEALARTAGTSFTSEVTADGDSALFALAMTAGEGRVVGPDSTRAGWRIARVEKIEPRRRRTFDEAYPLVQKDWYERDGERRMRALLDALRRRSQIEVNDDALARLPGAARLTPAKSHS